MRGSFFSLCEVGTFTPPVNVGRITLQMFAATRTDFNQNCVHQQMIITLIPNLTKIHSAVHELQHNQTDRHVAKVTFFYKFTAKLPKRPRGLVPLLTFNYLLYKIELLYFDCLYKKRRKLIYSMLTVV